MSLVPVNDNHPVLNSTSPHTFTENDRQFYPFQNLTITDSDNYCLPYGGYLASAEITLKGFLTNETLMLSEDWVQKGSSACNASVVLPNPTDVELLHNNATLYYYDCGGNGTAMIRIVGRASIAQYQVRNHFIISLYSYCYISISVFHHYLSIFVPFIECPEVTSVLLFI